MPRLLLFVPCNRATIDALDASLSLTTVFCMLDAFIDPGEPDDPNRSVAMPWSVAAYWRRLPGEEDVEFETAIVLVRPDDAIVMQIPERIKLTGDAHTTRFHIPGFPVGIQGEYQLKMLVCAAGEEQWQEASSYPIMVTHRAPEVAV